MRWTRSWSKVVEAGVGIEASVWVVAVLEVVKLCLEAKEFGLGIDGVLLRASKLVCLLGGCSLVGVEDSMCCGNVSFDYGEKGLLLGDF